MPIVPDAMEVVEMPLYDTEDLRRIGQRVQLFAIPLGGQSPSIWREPRPKDIWETNLYLPGTLEYPCEFLVRNLSVLLYDKHGPLPVFDRAGLANLWAKSHLDFRIDMKTYWQGPLHLLADPVCQLGGLAAIQAMDDSSLYTTMRMLNFFPDHPLDCRIFSQQMFQVQVTPYTPVCRQVSVRVILNGHRIRPRL